MPPVPGLTFQYPTMPKLWNKQFQVPALLLLLCLGFSPISRASHPKTDMELLEAVALQEMPGQLPQISMIQQPDRSLIATYNPISLAFSGMMYVYQRYLSPQLPSACLYEHSCSNFSKSLIAEYGMVKGIFTTADRLMRCNRIAAIDIRPLSIGASTGRVMESTDVYKSNPE